MSADLFKMGAFSCYAVVGGRRVGVLGFTLQISLNQLPRLSMGLPLGAPTDGGDALTIQELLNLFKRYTPVQLYVISHSVGGSSGVGDALAPGSYKVFDGVVESALPTRTARSMEMSVVCQHRMAKLLGASSLFSPFLPTDLANINFVYTGVFRASKETDIEAKADTWETVTQSVEAIIGSISKRYDDLIKRIGEARFSALQDANNEAVRMLSSDVDSLLYMFRDLPAVKWPLGKAIHSHMSQSLQSTPNMWNTLVALARHLDFCFIPLVDRVVVAPFWPFQPASTVKVLPSGSFFSNRRLSSGAGDFSMIVGSVATAAAIGPYSARPLEAVDNVGHYLVPEGFYSEDYAVLQLLSFPGWLSSIPRGEDEEKISDLSSPPQQREEKSVQEAGLVGVVNDYSKMRTLEQLYGNQSLELSTSLRFDILPGQGIRADVGLEQSGVSTYGMVTATVLTLDADRKTASTEIAVSFPRSESEQRGVVEDGAVNHYCWADRSQQVSDLAWTKRG